MAVKNINDLNIITTLIVGLFGIWGAILNYIKRRELKKISFTQRILYLFIDTITSTGIAVLTFIALEGWGVNELLSVAGAGFAAHQGTRMIYFAQIAFADKFGLDKTIETIQQEHQIEKENK